jgi:hypothetical protein
MRRPRKSGAFIASRGWRLSRRGAYSWPKRSALPARFLVDEQAERTLRVTLAIWESKTSSSTPIPAGGDRVRNRGVPIVTRAGLGGAIAGTQPEQAVCGGDD